MRSEAIRQDDPALRERLRELAKVRRRFGYRRLHVFFCGERVLSRREAAAYGAAGATPPVNITIMTQNAESFRQSRTQVAADIARAVSFGRRGM